MRLRSWFLWALGLLGTTPLSGVTPHLVKDINPIPSTADSSPRDFVAAAGVAFFTASDGEAGNELWRTDGTLPGTFRVTDACPGECSSQIRTVAATDRSYFFLATGESGEDLWVTGGTTAGTFRLTSSLTFPTSGTIWQAWVASQGVLYFSANDGAHGLELWRTDGTPAGTFLVTDVRRGPEGSDPRLLVDFNGRLFFRADDGLRGAGLWRSDGTAKGTQPVRDPVPGSASHGGPGSRLVIGRTLYFTAPTPDRGLQLWRSDGTTKGTVPLTTLVPRPGSPAVLFSMTVLGNRLFFVADTKGLGQEVWVTDGTVKGTRPLTNFAPPEVFFSADFSFFLFLPQRHLGNRMVFPVNDGAHGFELWTTDGTPSGTQLLRDICPGACGSTAATPVPNGNLLYFNATDGVFGDEPWMTDGTPAGTRMVRDLCAGSCSSSPFGFDPAGRWVYFQSGEAVWRTNGTAQGTVLLTPYRFPPPSAANPRGFQRVVLGRSLLFASSHGGAGLELWRSDGTPQGSRLLADLNTTDLGGSYPSRLLPAGDKVYFYATDGQGYDLWRSDGTAAGTSLFAPLEPVGDPPRRPSIQATVEMGGAVFVVYQDGQNAKPSLWRLDAASPAPVRLTAEDLSVGFLRVAGGTLFFVASDEEHGRELWRTDGTVAGTRLVADLDPGFSGSEPEILAVFKGHLYFTADAGSLGRELWRTDGTEAGTVLLKDIHPNDDSDADLLTEHAGRLWFFATDEEHGRELWSTDGTPAGTRVHELVPGPEGFSADHMTWDGDRLFLFGGGLWISDTTPEGTHRISNVVIVQDPFGLSVPIVANGTLYFSGFLNALGGSTLWKSDGTEAGTVQVLDRGGLPVSDPQFFQAFAGRVFFTSLSGRLFQTDGTAAGTFPFLELSAPSEGTHHELVRAGSRLFFRKWDRTTGSELWALETD